MKCFIRDTKKRFLTKDIFDEQSQWEILKCEIRQFSICYSKVIAKEKWKTQRELERKGNLKSLKNLSCHKNIENYQIYGNVAEGVKIRSRCQWYKENEKSKYFLNLEKK